MPELKVSRHNHPPKAVLTSVLKLGFLIKLSKRFCLTKSAAFGPPCPARAALFKRCPVRDYSDIRNRKLIHFRCACHLTVKDSKATNNFACPGILLELHLVLNNFNTGATKLSRMPAQLSGQDYLLLAHLSMVKIFHALSFASHQRVTERHLTIRPATGFAAVIQFLLQQILQHWLV